MGSNLLDDQILDGDFSSSAIRSKDEVKRINLTKIEINDNIRLILKSRWIFIALIGFQLIGALSLYYSETDPAYLMGAWLEIGVVIALYATCAFLVTRKPVLAFALGLGFYILLNVVVMLVLAVNPISGILFKLAILGYLGYGLMSSMKYKKNLQKLKYFRITEDEISSLEQLKPVRKTPYPKVEE